MAAPKEMHSTLQATVLSVAADVFRAKAAGQSDTTMYRLYMADAKGHVGYIYSKQQYAPGDIVDLGLAERDGKLKLSVVATSPHI